MKKRKDLALALLDLEGDLLRVPRLLGAIERLPSPESKTRAFLAANARPCMKSLDAAMRASSARSRRGIAR